MKQKIKTVVFSLFVALLGGVLFTACDQDSFDLKKEGTYLTVDDYASKLVESTIGIQEDLWVRNRQIFDLPDRFSKELSLLSKVTNYGELETLINTTALDLDLSKINAKIILLEEVSEALSQNAFSEENLLGKVNTQSRDLDWLVEERMTLRRDRMSCLRDYDASTYKILLGEISCFTASVIRDGGTSAPVCAVSALTALVGANITYNNCLAQARTTSTYTTTR
ncbi:MAG: hypothetical protein Sapg2KO_40040 [Saprospiraceae bacterium]